jgi:hypothetical protein
MDYLSRPERWAIEIGEALWIPATIVAVISIPSAAKESRAPVGSRRGGLAIWLAGEDESVA